MSKDFALMLLTGGVLLAVAAISYAVDDLYHRRHGGVKDDIDRELEQLIGEDK